MNSRGAFWRERTKTIIRNVIQQMESEGRYASSKNIALGLKCPAYLVRTLRQELAQEGVIASCSEDCEWVECHREEIPPDYQERIAIVRTWKQRLMQDGRPAKLSMELLERILP